MDLPYDKYQEKLIFGYTGQRKNSYTDLMDYKARFYDSALGRFLQPASIIPGMGNPQSLNRFSYVLNSPIGFNDPSGHMVSCEQGDQCEHDTNVFVDPAPLSQQGKRGSGKQMKKTYDRFAKMCATGDEEATWCSASGGFSMTDFMILIMSNELSPFGALDPFTGRPIGDDPSIRTTVSTAAANWFSESCLAHRGCSGVSPNAVFNWLGENFESAQRLFTNNPTTQYPNVKGLAKTVVDAVLSVGSHPKSAGTWGLVHWGNKSYYEASYGRGHFPSQQYELLGGKNPFYVIPYGEENLMNGGGSGFLMSY